MAAHPHRLVEAYGGPGRVVRFTPARDDSDDETTPGPGVPAAPTTGHEARQFYEQLINEPSTALPPIKTRRHRKKSPKKERPPEIADKDLPKWKTRLLKSAQNNDVEDVRLCLEAGVDINSKDEYDWTALMCAAQAGANDVVRCLLSNNCDETRKDSTGRTAAGIALIANRISTYELIERGLEREVIVKPEPEDVFACGTCDRNVTGTRPRHEASLAHQLSETGREHKTTYQLPEHNRGYQMMLRSGWSQEHGLGPEGQGQKYPVKTVLRKDRACLGHEHKLKSRVTHTSDQIREKPTKVQRPNKPKGKEWERAMRSYMNS